MLDIELGGSRDQARRWTTATVFAGSRRILGMPPGRMAHGGCRANGDRRVRGLRSYRAGALGIGRFTPASSGRERGVR